MRYTNFFEILNLNKNNSICCRLFVFIQWSFFKLLGLSPWTSDTSGIFRNKNRNNTCRISYAGICYNIIFFLFNITFAPYGLFYELSNKTYQGSNSTIMLVKMLFIALLCTSLIPFIYIIRQKTMIKVINKLKNVDEILNKCSDYKLKNDCVNTILFAVNLFMTINFIIVYDLVYYPAITIFFGNIPSVLSSGVMIQYAMQLNRIDKRFESINMAICKLGYSKLGGQVQVSSVAQLLSRESILYDIENFKYAYVKLCRICDDMADFYGVPILIAIVCCGFRSVMTLNRIIFKFTQLEAIDIVLPVPVSRMVCLIFLFTVITSSVSAITKQVL